MNDPDIVELRRRLDAVPDVPNIQISLPVSLVRNIVFKLDHLRKQCVLVVMACNGTSDDDENPAPLVAKTIEELTIRSSDS